MTSHPRLWLTTGMKGKPGGLNSDAQMIMTILFDWGAETEIQVTQQSLFSLFMLQTLRIGMMDKEDMFPEIDLLLKIRSALL